MHLINSWVKAIAVTLLMLTSMLVLSGCNEEHPDNLPGAVNNPYPELSVTSESSVTLDPADTSMVYSVPVQLSVSAPESGEVFFRLVSGTAIEDRDYLASSGKVTFNKGDRQVNIELTLLNDNTRSQERSFRLELTRAVNAELSAAITHTVLLTPYESPYPELSLSEEVTVAIDPADSSMLYTVPVSFSKAAPMAGQIMFRAIPDTAKEGRDYEPVTGSISFNAGARQAAIEVTLINDLRRVEARTFRLLLTDTTHAVLGNSINQSITIEPLGNAGAPSVLTVPPSLGFMAPTTAEESYSVVLPLSSRLKKDASVQIRSIPGTAREGIHYREITSPNCVAGTCTLLEGEAELSFWIPIIGQTADDSRNFKLQFLAAENMELGDVREVEVTLNYTEEAVIPELNVPSTLTLRMPSIERGTVTYPIIMTLSNMLQHNATIEWRTVDDSAIAGVHYQPVNATGANAVSLNAGQTEFELAIELIHDLDTEENINFQLQMVTADGVKLPTNRMINVEVIHSNDNTSTYPQVSFPDTFTLQEPTATSTDLNMYLSLSEALPEDAELSLRFIDGTAEQGADFEVLKERLFLRKGSNEVAVPVRLIGNSAVTSDIQFTVELSNPLNLALPKKRDFIVQIIDEAEAPAKPLLNLTPSLIRVPVARGTKPEQMTLYFPLSGVLADPAGATVLVESRNGSAAAGVEFVEITGPSKALMQNDTELALDISLLPQLMDEPREFELVFSQGSGLELPEFRAVTVQIEPRDTPNLPELIAPIDPVEFTAPQYSTSNKLRKIVLPFNGVAPLAGRITVFVEDETGREGIDFVVRDKTPAFNIGAQEVVIELDVEPASGVRRFRIIVESGENVVLPSDFGNRVIDVTINPF